MPTSYKTARAFISVFLAIFTLFSAMSVGVSAYAETERVYSIPDVLHNSTSADMFSKAGLSSLKEYLRKELIKSSARIDIRAYNVSGDDVEELGSLIYDRMPEMFHVSGLSYSVHGGKIAELIPKYNCTPAEYTVMYNKCVESADEILSGITGNSKLSAVQKALLIHDRLAVLCEYDSINLESGIIPPESFTMYGALVKGVAVCQGYSEAYEYLLEEVGIESYLCESDVLNHAWNIVVIDGKEYHVDVTWDDPTYDRTGRVKHDNFLRSSNGIYSTGHTATDYYNKPCDTTYDNYFWQNSNAEFQLVGNEIYFIDSKSAQIKKYSDKRSIVSVADYWAASGGAYWVGNFSLLSSDGVHLFYNKAAAVYMFDLATMTATEVWKPDRSAMPNMSIYGFTFRDGKFICDVYNTPNFGLTTKTKYQQQKEWKNIKSVIRNTMPEKTEYYIGDIFDPTGLSLRVFYTDNSQEIITAGYTVTSFDTTKTGDSFIVVSYGQRNVLIPITVKTPSIQLSETYLHVDEGESKQIVATTIPSGQAVVWSANNDNVSVTQNGTVTGVADGKAEITAYFVYNGYFYSAICNIDAGCLHSLVSHYPAKESTCTEHGHNEYSVCNICGDILTGSAAPLPLLEHDFVENEEYQYIVREATCTTVAVYYKSCSACGEASTLTFNSDYYAPHVKEIIPEKEPTCTEAGLAEGAKCSVCQYIIRYQDIIEATGHTPEIIPGNPATETETGLTDGEKCSVCGEILKEQEIIPVTGHIIVTLPAKEPTCTETGLTEGKKCITCGNILHAQQILPATGHTPEIIPGNPATETETGLTDGEKCSVCGTVTKEQVEIPVLPPVHKHDYVGVVTKPDCTEQGYTTYTCSCGEEYKDNYVNATGHDVETIIFESTCIVAGEKYDTCKICDEIVNLEILELVPHTPEIIPGKESTDTEAGLTEGKKCSVCGIVIKTQEIIPAKGHTIVTISAKAPTCTANGLTEGKKCITCGNNVTVQQIIPAKGHSLGEWQVVTAPTIGKTGLEQQKCVVCGVIVNEREIPALKEPIDKPVNDKLEVKGDLVKVDNSTKISTIGIKNKVESIENSIMNEKVSIVDKDGNALGKDDYIGTGAQIQIVDNSGKVISTYNVVVPNDVDGNGKTTAADARLALRGSAKLEKIEGVYALASDVTGDNKVTAADARKILRVSAGLEKP